MLILAIGALGGAIVLLVLSLGVKGSGENASGDVVVVEGPGAGAASRSRFLPASGDSDELLPLYRRFGGLARRLSPANYGRSLQHKLDLAGNPRSWTADRVLAFKGIGLILGLGLGALAGARHGIGVLLFPCAGGLLGFFLTDIWVHNLGERRQALIRNGLPDAIDMMTVCVEAGLGFDAALSRVALNLDGPVASEFARVIQEMQFGKSRTEALRSLVERTDVPELRAFVSSLVQSAELGISVGDVLREQAKEMRVKRRQRAEEKAQKLPVKILFPLLICLLPALFVVVLGPAVLDLIRTFQHLNA